VIAWIVGIVTLILLLFVVWQRVSKNFRERAEAPKYLFIENFGIAHPRRESPEKPKDSQEENHESTQP
jgi:hypothetical protein